MAAGARIGRNDPCPCGSSRKYKRCCLARDEAPELLRLRMRRAEGRLVPEVLQWNIELRETYFAIRDDIHHPRPPKLCNTDGDPLVPTTLRFDLRCPPGEAFERLKSLALDMGDGELLADAERDAAGQLRAVRFSWLERGNRQHESWENTVLGTIAIDGPRLTIEVNSARRSRRIRTQVEERLGEDAVFRAALTESIEEQLARTPSPEEERRRARAREESERLKALFAEFACHARHATQPELAPDVAELRARLGM